MNQQVWSGVLSTIFLLLFGTHKQDQAHTDGERKRSHSVGSGFQGQTQGNLAFPEVGSLRSTVISSLLCPFMALEEI